MKSNKDDNLDFSVDLILRENEDVAQVLPYHMTLLSLP